MQANESFIAKAIVIHVSAAQMRMRDWSWARRIHHLQIVIQRTVRMCARAAHAYADSRSCIFFFALLFSPLLIIPVGL